MSEKISADSDAGVLTGSETIPLLSGGLNKTSTPDTIATRTLAVLRDTDVALAANSDSKFATQKAVKAYVDALVVGLLDFKGSTDASGNSNYPAASKGDAYAVTVAGKVGGASGKSVDIGDLYVASADNAGGTEASVGTSWFVLEHNLVGAALTSGTLAQFAATTSAQLRGVLSDETGTGAAVFADTPTLVTPNLGAAVVDALKLSSSGIIADATTTRVLSAGDNGKVLYFTSASAITLSMASGLGVGFSCIVIQGGAGQITFAANSQTMTVANGCTKTASVASMASIIAPAANTFLISGALS